MDLTLADFNALIIAGLVPDKVYTFTGRYTANMAADMVRTQTAFVTEWVGPQQFMIR